MLAATCFLKGHMCHTLNFVHVVAHGVEGREAVFIEGARLREIQSAQQFADNQNVSTSRNVLTQRRTIRDSLVCFHRTQVGESAERLSQREQTSLGTLLTGEFIEFPRSHRTEKHSVGFQAGCQRFVRQRLSILLDGRSADAMRLETKLVAAHIRNRLQHSHGLPGYFRADSISRQYDNAQLHAGRISGEGLVCSRMPLRWVHSMASKSCS